MQVRKLPECSGPCMGESNTLYLLKQNTASFSSTSDGPGYLLTQAMISFYAYRLTVVKVLHRVVRWNGNEQEFVLTVIIQNKPYVNSNIHYIHVQWTSMSPISKPLIVRNSEWL